MIKKCLAFTLTFAMLFPLTALASIDVSVFENKDIYKVEIDDFDDTGTITFVSSKENEDAPTNLIIGAGGEDSSDKGALIGTFDIKMISDGSIAAMRFNMMYMGEDWVFVDDFIVKTNKHRYTFEVDRDTDNEGGKVYESFTLAFNDENKSMLEDLIEDGGTAQYRLSGDRKVDGKLSLAAEGLKTMYDDYIEAGGFEQDFTGLSSAFPCEIKDLDE